ncbi:MAG: Double zinc ribbon [Chloroflexi bacterium ADurb.Bin325]|nr:MAG: Double zinc ribbon [Chloroflexi bacterium ADurb.Bin325]
MSLPSELLNQIGVVLELIVAFFTATLVAFWIGFAVWTFRDIRSRTRDIFAWLLAVILVLALGPVGLLLYLLMRPKDTLAAVYDRQLEEEALLREITERRACPNCQTITEPGWLICPQCRTELRRTCAACGKPLELHWIACPYCTTPVAEPQYVDESRFRPAVIAPPPATTTEPVAAPATLTK